MKSIDINVDVGEGFPFDDELLHIATSANVCCGAHAGSPQLTQATVLKCRALGVAVGAHPGVPDRESMGRVAPKIAQRELIASLYDQVIQTDWDYLKPHGWLYNSSTSDEAIAALVLSLATIKKLPLLGMPGTLHQEIATSVGVAFKSEGFADRRYAPDGGLVARTKPNAILTDLKEIADQVLQLAEHVDSICVHGDTPGCAEIAGHVRATLEHAGYKVERWR